MFHYENKELKDCNIKLPEIYIDFIVKYATFEKEYLTLLSLQERSIALPEDTALHAAIELYRAACKAVLENYSHSKVPKLLDLIDNPRFSNDEAKLILLINDIVASELTTEKELDRIESMMTNLKNDVKEIALKSGTISETVLTESSKNKDVLDSIKSMTDKISYKLDTHVTTAANSGRYDALSVEDRQNISEKFKDLEPMMRVLIDAGFPLMDCFHAVHYLHKKKKGQLIN